MRTTLDLPDDLFREAKARAALEGMKLKDLIAEYVRQGLNTNPRGAFEKPRVRSEFPVLHGVGGPGMRLWTNAEAQELFDAEDLVKLNENLAG
jgi:hypothetical protein